MDRKKIIEKLKNIKDPRERDRIIWALAGKEKDEPNDTSTREISRKAASTPAPGQTQRLPRSPGDARKLLGYVVPAILIFFGLVNIVQALMHFNTGQSEAGLPQLIMGAMFLLFGLFSIVKVRKQVQSGNADQKET